jgi:hypothetical protein
MSTEQRDWVAWHERYRDQRSALSRRLSFVQEQIRRALPADPEGVFRAVSLCAGQGDDLIGALADYPQADRIRARLVELEPRNVAVMMQRARDAGLQLEIVQGDAADTRLYEGAVPADLVLACGIFGNVSDSDVFSTLRALPQFCAPGATLVWTRSRRAPDLTPSIRQALAEVGFSEIAFFAPDDILVAAGAARWDGQPQPLTPARLFQFIR